MSAKALADLGGGKADAGRAVHRLEHAGDQVAHKIGVGRLHRAGARLEDLMGRDQDRPWFRSPLRCHRS